MKTNSFKAYGTEAAEADLKQMSIDRREALPKDVEIDMQSLKDS
jgi:uncharacterized zinc-type alcohol dehydrogenase-like protein